VWLAGSLTEDHGHTVKEAGAWAPSSFCSAAEKASSSSKPPSLCGPISPDGGPGLTLQERGFIDGTVSISVSLVAGLLGGLLISKFGLKKPVLFMAFCINVPNLSFVYLSQVVSPEAPVSMSTIA